MKKSVLITGATGGIGNSICDVLKDEYDLYLLGRQESKLMKSSKRNTSVKKFFICDLSNSKEIRSWPIQVDSKALEAAGIVHTDFERGVICAEVIAYKEYVSLGGVKACKNAGKIRLEGKDYILSEGDVIHFRFNVQSAYFGKCYYSCLTGE